MRVFFYKTGKGRSPVREFIDELPDLDQARFLQLIEEIEEHGLAAVRVIFKPIHGKLWELKFRASGGSFRIFYVLVTKDQMVWLHAFKKKTQKTPKNEMELALNRMKDIL